MIERTASGIRARVLERAGDALKPVHTQTLMSETINEALERFTPDASLKSPMSCVLLLPRSSFFWVWRSQADQNTGSVPGADVFPVPLDLLEWRSFPSAAGTTIDLGILKASVDGYRDRLNRRGIILEGVAPRSVIWGAAVPGDADLFVDDVGETIEIGVRSENEVVFCKKGESSGSLIDDVRNVAAFARGRWPATTLNRVTMLLDPSREPGRRDDVRRSLEKEGFAVHVVESAAMDDAAALARLVREGRFIPLATSRSLSAAGRFWKTHQKNILAAASLTFVVGSLALNAAIDTTRLETRKLLARQRLLRSESTLISGSRKELGPDPAVPVLSAVLKNVPTASYLIEYRYDEPHRSLHLSGRAADYEKVSQFAGALARQPALRDVRGGKASLVQVDHRTAVDFTVEATVP